MYVFLIVKHVYISDIEASQHSGKLVSILLDNLIGPSKYLVVILTPIIALHTPNFTVRYEKKVKIFSDFIISRIFVICESRENKKVMKISTPAMER